MKAKRRKEITVETHEVTVIRFKRSQANLYCAECGQQTQHLSVVEAISLLSLSETELFCLAQDRRIHSNKSEKGLLLLCCNSLALLIQE